MAIQQLKCPNCNGRLEMGIKDDKEIFCPYCGELFLPQKNIIEINNNTNITKHIFKTNRNIDENKLIEEFNKNNKEKYKFYTMLVLCAMFVILMLIMYTMA